jgi:CMP-N-acetylneuraminic acid synthetase
MYKNSKILGIIPARGGSKGVPRKNLRPLAGKPLIAWTIEAAQGSSLLDRVILSSEDEEIMETAQRHGLDVPFKRPPELARDDTPGILPVLHALEMLSSENYTHVVLLQPTSPMRNSEDIDGAIRLCIDRAAPACLGVCEAPHPPWWMFGMDADRKLSPLMAAKDIPLRRQDAPKAYQLNGAIYVAEIGFIKSSKGFIGPESLGYAMPGERSLDIDSELDILLAESLLAAQANRKISD